MRKGQNPAKSVKTVAKPERITVAVLTYLPFLSGFYEEGLDVLKVSLESMRKDAGLPFDLMVFDNGSCAEARDYLIAEKEAGRIQYLLLSEKNLGKGGAWNMILAGAPGEIIAYADSDILYYPKWLSRSVEILETFPNVGMVTARPFRTPPRFYTSTLKWARENATCEEGQFIPWETFLEFNLSLGQTEEENVKVYAETSDWKIVYEGVSAMAGASHWQFVAYKSTLQQFLPFDMSRPMGQVRQLDERMNEAGLLRLMVFDPLVMNLSNTLGYLRGEMGQKKVEKKSNSVWEFAPVKKVLLFIYNWIFNRYYG
jgi:glycosyltransferase involved in cell wall biosynthesis